MDRITKKHVDSLLARFAESQGLPPHSNFANNVGALFIDFAPVYGGARICQIVDENGHTAPAFGNNRCSLKEMHGRLAFALDCQYLKFRQPVFA